MEIFLKLIKYVARFHIQVCIHGMQLSQPNLTVIRKYLIKCSKVGIIGQARLESEVFMWCWAAGGSPPGGFWVQHGVGLSPPRFSYGIGVPSPRKFGYGGVSWALPPKGFHLVGRKGPSRRCDRFTLDHRFHSLRIASRLGIADSRSKFG